MMPENVLIYYGYPNSFNSAVNGWDNEKVAQDLAKYSHIVFGDGLEETTHPDYANFVTILARLRVLNSECQVYGYVSANQASNLFHKKVKHWKSNLHVDGIFMDECGYDFGKSRQEFNLCLDMVHSHDLVAFVNAWNTNHVIGTVDDPMFPNINFNPDNLESNLNECDWINLENFAIFDNFYEEVGEWKARLDRVTAIQEKYCINFAAVSEIFESNADAQTLFNFLYINAIAAGLQGVGSSDQGYGASSAKVTMWQRPAICGACGWEDAVNVQSIGGAKYARYLPYAKIVLDYTTSAQAASVQKY